MFDHVFASCGRLLFVNPIRLYPVFLGDQTELDLGVREGRNTATSEGEHPLRSDHASIHVLLELIGEGLFIEEYIGILELLVETIL